MSTDEVLEKIFGKFRIDTHSAKCGWISNFFDQNGINRGTGVRKNQSESINVSISEAIERYSFFNSLENNSHLVEKYPSSCGFATGLHAEKASIRSWLEAFERWSFSKWIDNSLYLTQTTSYKLTELTKELCKDFTEVIRFEKNFKSNEHELPFDVRVGVTVGLTSTGAFVGSRVSHTDDEIWEHSAVEAWINLHNIKNGSRYLPGAAIELIDQRVQYFAYNKTHALAQIPSKNNFVWPRAEILYKSQVQECPTPFLTFRTLYKDYVGWHSGPIQRFVY